MTKLTEFISHVKTGMAKTSHFEVMIARSLRLQNEPLNSNMRKILMFCDQAQLPGSSFMTNQVRSYGESKEVAYEKVYDPVNLSFYVDANFMVRDFFQQWIDSIQDRSTRDFNFPSTYLASTVDIVVQDSQETNRYMCSLYNAYPKSVSSIQLDYASKDIMKLQVSLVYEYARYEMMGNYTKVADNSIGELVPALPSFDYGFNSFTTIPDNYFSDFSEFQDQLDFTTGSVSSVATMEQLDELTGFGGVFV